MPVGHVPGYSRDTEKFPNDASAAGASAPLALASPISPPVKGRATTGNDANMSSSEQADSEVQFFVIASQSPTAVHRWCPSTYRTDCAGGLEESVCSCRPEDGECIDWFHLCPSHVQEGMTKMELTQASVAKEIFSKVETVGRDLRDNPRRVCDSLAGNSYKHEPSSSSS